MYAITVSSSIPDESVQQVIAMLKEGSAMLQGISGFRQGYFVHDVDHHTVMSLALFDTREQAVTSWEEQGGAGMAERVEALGGTVEVHFGEVFHQVSA
jgi:heme-degrading monooxygenase HmoA